MRVRGPIVYFALLSASLASCSEQPQANGPATDEAIAAIALPERQLRTMLLMGSLRSQTIATAMYSLGLQQGCQELQSAVDEAVQSHLPAWRENLLAAYREKVPANELASAAQQSPEAAQALLKEHLRPIGESMQAKSSSLLNEAGADVLERLAERASSVDGASVDRAARMTELKEARRAGGICLEQMKAAESVEA